MPELGISRAVPDGGYGSVWRCDDCGELWRIAFAPCSKEQLEWRAAWWWQRWRYRERRS